MLRLAFAVLAALLALIGIALAATGTVPDPRPHGGPLVLPFETTYGFEDAQQARSLFAEPASPQLVAQAATGNFYLYEFEQQSGPFSTTELIEQISIGNIGKSAYVWQPGFEDWVPIETISEFAAAFPEEIELPRPYYVIEDGRQVGPLNESEMQIRIIELLSRAEDLAWKAGLPEWTPLSEFPEFADQLAAAEVPALPRPPAHEEPPPLPDEITIFEPHEDDAVDEALWARLEETLTRQMPRIMSDATAKEQRAATACLLDLLRPSDAALWRLLIDSDMSPSDEQAAEIDRLDPNFVEAASNCIDEAQAMKDMLDAMIWNAITERLPDGSAERQLQAYKCMKEATEVLSQEHRELIIAEGSMAISDETAALMEENYPGITAKVEACDAMIADALTVPPPGGGGDVATPPLPRDDDGGAGAAVVPPPAEGGDDPATPLVPPAGDDGSKDAGTEGGPSEPERPAAVKPEGTIPDPFTAAMLMAAVRDALAQGGMPPYLVDRTAPCFAGQLEAVITDAEKQAIIANGLTDAMSATLEAAHPGIGERIAGCFPRYF